MCRVHPRAEKCTALNAGIGTRRASPKKLEKGEQDKPQNKQEGGIIEQKPMLKIIRKKLEGMKLRSCS